MAYSCLNGCGATEKVPSMKMKKQASWRTIQQLGLVPLYKNDDDFRLFCGMMDGLAF
jgi:hypothetical protein